MDTIGIDMVALRAFAKLAVPGDELRMADYIGAVVVVGMHGNRIALLSSNGCMAAAQLIDVRTEEPWPYGDRWLVLPCKAIQTICKGIRNGYSLICEPISDRPGHVSVSYDRDTTAACELIARPDWTMSVIGLFKRAPKAKRARVDMISVNPAYIGAMDDWSTAVKQTPSGWIFWIDDSLMAIHARPADREGTNLAVILMPLRVETHDYVSPFNASKPEPEQEPEQEPGPEPEPEQEPEQEPGPEPEQDPDADIPPEVLARIIADAEASIMVNA